ncbi:WD0 repeat family small nuclear ribonucleoprotein Prp4p-related [Cryptosporidium bovis]|uniref:WD0 repeat family small nuclear ribonucleoprotein Prp4p-related n=1 Tax=Cryptosporidium bovis TaxID=310047 RepID=UPI003519DAF9|nr:WD0 repeat family small nuclear ribonucleoprotein Prp4p-related [Cryptosporidium bovis]
MNYQLINVAVSTNDETVKSKLRELGEPVCYFGEGPFERRERLSKIISTQTVKFTYEPDSISEINRERFFSQGGLPLVDFRKKILSFSIPKSYFRLKDAREKGKKINFFEKKINYMATMINGIEQITCEMCDNRYLTGCRISPLQGKVATFGLGPNIKIWDVCSFSVENSIKTAGFGTNDLRWFSTETGEHFVTCDSGANIILWGNEYQERGRFIGHEDQVNKISIHPLPRYLISASSDETWRIWDIETNSTIQTQEGHCKPIFGLDIHPDGALVITGDAGGIFRIWDIRSGMSILHNLSHTKKIAKTQFSPNCDATFITSSEDNCIKVWDIRRTKNPLKECLLGHSKRISDVMYEPSNGLYIISASLDGTLKFWSKFVGETDMCLKNSQSSRYSCIRNINTASHNVTGFDIFKNGTKILTVGLDHTLRLWSCQNTDNLKEK